jgi:general secretion pathway protein D
MRNYVTIQGTAIGAKICLLAAALTAALAMPRHAGAQGRTDAAVEDGLYSCGKAKGPVSVSFKPEVELKDLITWAMGFTCKNFVYSAGIGGRTSKVTIIAPKKMTSGQAWQVFLVGLQTMNLTVVPQGNVLRVVESATAKTEPLPLYRKGGPDATSQMVRMVMRPEHLSVDDVNTALSALKSKEGVVTSLPKSGIVVITDYGSIISKMRSLMRDIDQPSMGENLYLIRVNHADASELASKLQDILGAQGGGGGPAAGARGRRDRGPEMSPDGGGGGGGGMEAAVPSKIIAEERTNSLLVLASEPAYLRVYSLVKRLDVPVGGQDAGRIHVYYLENADAEEMSTTLTSAISGISQPSSQAGGARPGRAQQQQPRDGGRGVVGGAGGDSPAFEGQVRITHDKPTNALVIIASVQDFLALRDVIRKLDIPRMQVFIEAVILEVNVSDSLDLGTSFHGGTALDDGGIALGGLQHSSLQSILPSTLAGSYGLLGGILGPLLPEARELLGVSIPSFGILFQALATRGNVNVLSSPHILTTNNQEAEISVGENIPYQSGFSNFGAGAGGLALPVQSVQRQDVALTLKITPHINASDMVRLEIDQEISDIASRNFEGLGPSWAKRAIKTTVVVRDQQSIVIGGLISDRVTYSESKIPLLGDVPILGYLFKYSQKSKSKTNLLVLLTPYVIKDQMDIEEIVQRKVRERSEFVRAYSTFASRREVGTQVDYRRKRGLLEEMNRTLQAIEKDVTILREAEMQRDVLPDGIIELRVEGGISADADSEDSAEGAFDPSRAGEGGIEDGN